MDWRTMDSAPRDGTRVLLFTAAGITIGKWVEEESLSHCGRAVQYAGWQGDAWGETRPGTNTGDEAEAKQHCPPLRWAPLIEPDIPEEEWFRG